MTVTDENGLLDLTASTGSVRRLIEMSLRHVDLSLSQSPSLSLRGRFAGRGYGDESFSEVMESWVA